MSAAARRTSFGGALARGGAFVARFEHRRLLYRTILRAIPIAIPRRFDAEAAGDLNSLFELRIRHPARPRTRSFRDQDLRRPMRGATGGAGEGVTAVTVAPGDLVRLASAATGWPELLSRGRLELEGNPFEALRFPTLFRLPARAAAAA
jgi:hypothetical protein